MAGTTPQDYYVSEFSGEEIDAEISKTRWQSNPNLLDNWYFVGGGTSGNFPINQRGQTSYNAAGYTIDMWKSSSNNLTVTVDEDGITLAASGGTCYLTQYLEVAPMLTGGGTLSALVASVSGEAYFRTAYTDGTYSPAVALTTGLNAYAVSGVKKIDRVIIQVAAGATVKLRAVKLEPGDRQTLAHQEDSTWVFNEIPSYADELARCQRFFVALKATLGLNGIVTSDGKVLGPTVPLPCAMRAKPTASYSGKIVVRGIGGYSGDASYDEPCTTATVEVGYFSGSAVRLKIMKADGTAWVGLTNNTPIAVSFETGELRLSAEL